MMIVRVVRFKKVRKVRWRYGSSKVEVETGLVRIRIKAHYSESS